MISFSDPFIRRPVGTTLIAIGLFLLGAVAYHFLPVACDAECRFPGDPRAGQPAGRRSAGDGGDGRRRLSSAASPRSPASTEITSYSSVGSANITLQFDLAATLTAPRATCRRRSTPPRPNCRAICRRFPALRKANPNSAPVLILALTSPTVSPRDALRCRRYRPGPTHRADRGRRRGDGLRRRAACRSRAGQSRARSHRPGLSMEDVRTPSSTPTR